MVAAAFFFSTMAVGIKFASADFSTAEIVLSRGLVSVIFVAMVMRSRRISLVTPVPMMHVWRNLAGVLAMICWFYAIAHLPLATAMTLNYMSGVWVAAFVIGGALLYGKPTRQGPLLAAVLGSFAGVILMLRPTLDQNQLFAGLIGLFSGLASAMAVMQVTALSKAGEPEIRTVFYFSVGILLTGLIGVSLTGFTPLPSAHWQAAAWLIPIGVLSSLGQWCMTRALSRGATLLVVNLQYVGIVFAALFGLVLFGDQIALISWAGIIVIVISGIAATVLRMRVLPEVPVEDH